MKKEVQALLKRRRRRMPLFLAAAAGLVTIGGLVALVYSLAAGPARALFRTPTPTPSQTSTPVPPTATAEATETPASTSTPPVTAGPPMPITYTIQSGDTLYSIAQKFQVEFCLLLAVNQIANPNLVSQGQSLIIPTGDEKLPTPTPLPTGLGRGAVIKYAVECGDTLEIIAAKFNSTAADIAKRNRITDATNIQIGQIIEVRVNLVTPTPAPTATAAP